jgi:hypothetical protein
MLLDQNNSAQMPVDKRIDISTESPALPGIPPLIRDDELSSFAEVQTPEGKALHDEIRTMVERKAIARATLTKPSKSLAALMMSTPHISLAHPQVPKDIYAVLEPLEGQSGPPSYLTPDQIDDYIESIDIKLGLELPAAHVAAQPESQPDPSFGNSHSPYNWLRRNVPHIFLQDGEGSEKSHGKPGALRGAGKRASIPAPSKPDALEIVEEDGIGYEFALGGPVATKGKRKRDITEDDGSGGYHPKTGRVDDVIKVKKPRASKKKVSDESAASTPSTVRKRKPKAKAPQTPDVNVTPSGSGTV